MRSGREHGKPRTRAAFLDEGGGRAVAFAAFDTEVRLHAYPDDGETATSPSVRMRLDTALEACRERCVWFERRLSRTRPDSDIARAHAASPEPIAVAPETGELLELARGYCERSEGRFDITMGTVTSLWDFHVGRIPSSRALAQALCHVDYRLVQLGYDAHGAPTLAIADPATILDVGGIAKGYIADDLAKIMTAHGIGRFALNLGGNVLVRGGRPDPVTAAEGAVSAEDARVPPTGSPWRVGIRDPFGRARHRAVVDVVDGSVVTSGLRERCFIRGGTTYHHILDPTTGMPAATDVVSATIVAARSLDCDGYSTTAVMLGAAGALAFVEALDGVDAVIVDDADRVAWTSGLDGRIRVIGR